MAYSAEVVRRARARLAQAREDRESENLEHQAVAYARVPRLREIDRQLQQTMAKAAKAAFTQGLDGQAAMNQAREENLALQQEREELVRLHFEEGYLDDSPICDHCGGSGYVGTTMCECLLELCRQEQKKELTLLSDCHESFNKFRLDYYPDRYDGRYGASPRTIMEKNFKHCRTYASFFGKEAGNLLFIGGTGLGKTFLAACIARVVADRGYSVVYESAPILFEKLEQAKFNSNEENRREAERFYKCDLLIIDDLGTELTGPFVTAAVYKLLNERLLSKMPMVVTTNLNVDEVARRYSPQIASRLYGEFTRLTFVGEDIRMKNWGI